MTSVVRESKLSALRQRLADASRQKRLMVCSTQQPTTPGLTPHHAYALLAYDQNNDTVDLWNPHGNMFNPKGAPGLKTGYPTKNGLFTVPLPEFVQQFTGVTFEVMETASRQ